MQICTADHQCLIPPHSLPFLLSHRGVYHLQRSVSRLFFFFFLPAFKICFSLFSLSCQPSKLLPANTGTEREKKRQALLHSPGSDSPKLPLAHRSWLHSFFNANQMRSCNVWQHFFFFKGRQMYAKNVVFRQSSLSDIKINSHSFPSSRCSSRWLGRYCMI